MKILNLGCGTKTSSHRDVLNVDWSILLRLRKHRLMSPLIPLVLSGDRLERFRALPTNIVVHDLAKGIPVPDESVDVVYHSHMLEHLDRDVVEDFLVEARRVLKKGGVHRIVVPDLEAICKAYIADVGRCDADTSFAPEHDAYVARLLEQSVRKEAHGTSRQPALRRRIENLLLGDARRRGHTHQWMYDRHNLPSILNTCGYAENHVQSFKDSLVPGWGDYALDIDNSGCEYKPGSLYLEAVK